MQSFILHATEEKDYFSNITCLACFFHIHSLYLKKYKGSFFSHAMAKIGP
jgi:hypothetical protein